MGGINYLTIFLQNLTTPIKKELTDELAAEIKDRTGRATTPIVFIDGVYVGGFDELVELDQDGEL